MSDREEILQGIREMFVTAFTLTDAQVIVKNTDAARPPMPYLAVQVTVFDAPAEVLADWTEHGDNAGTPTKAARGPRTATVEVTAYDKVDETTARDWLEAIGDHIQRNVVLIDQLRAAGLVVRGLGNVADVSLLLDTTIEGRAFRTLAVAYERLGTAFDGVEFVYGELTGTLSSTTGPGSVTLTVFDPADPFC